MPIVRIPYPNALPTIQADFVAQNNLIRTGFLQVNKSIWEDAANNIVQGAVFQIGGTIYYANAATAIGGGASAYIKLTPSGDGTIVTPTYVANLAGVSWNSAYNGYYDVGGNAYIFDEIDAYRDGEISFLNTKIFSAILEMQGRRKGAMEIVLTEYSTTTVPKIAAGSGIEINGQWYYTDIDIIITGVTANSNWYDILLTPSGSTFTASFIARNTGTWSDSNQGLYSGNNRVGACVWRDSTGGFVRKNIIIVNNRVVKLMLDILDWDMTSSSTINIVHGLSLASLLDVRVAIINDNENTILSISGSSNYLEVDGRWQLSTSQIQLSINTSSPYNTIAYDEVPFNRGYVYLTYKV